MTVTELSVGWQYAHLGENDWKDITVPHDAMLYEPRSDSAAGGKNSAYFEGRDYLYRLKLALNKKSDRRYVIKFEGVYRNARVCLNGVELCFHPYGFTDFCVDVTDAAKSGDNLLEVYAYNSDQPNCRWYSGAGIYRPVFLYELPQKHICLNGIKIKTLDHRTGAISVAVNTSHGGRVHAEIYDGANAVASGDFDCDRDGAIGLTIPSVKPWSPDDPFLYTCKVTYFGVETTVVFGVRTVECDAANGLRINGERVVLRGACIHHDNGILGACAYPQAEERKIAILKKAGYNAVRSAHNPCSEALLDACDRLGMLVMDEYADMWYIHKNKYDYAEYLPERWRADLRSMVDKDFGHPSVIMYSVGNEVGETAERRGVELCGELAAYLRSLDGTRPVTCGVNIWFNAMARMGIGMYSDKKAAKTAARSAGGKKKDRAVGSELFNKLVGAFGAGFMKTMATLPVCDSATKDAFAVLDVAGYNYGIKRYARDVKKYPSRVICGTETFCADAERFVRLAKKFPAVIGDFVWAGMDYLGEVGIGSTDYKAYAKDFHGGLGWISAGSGRVDLTGRELGEALYTKVVFGLIPIAIAVEPAVYAAQKRNPTAWGMTPARPSWSWHGAEGKKTRVEIYTRAYKVGLFVNGKKVGEKKLKGSCRAVFETRYRAGEVAAVGYDDKNNMLCRTYLRTAGKETELKIEPETPVAVKDKLLFVRLRYTDAAGLTQVTARGEIKLQVKGGTLVGFGNGCPYNERGYITDTSDTYYGEALAIIKVNENVTVRAESALGNAEITVPCE